jgi:hypothetical protein
MLSMNTVLEKLILMKCELKKEAIQDLARGLQTNTSLKMLNIAQNMLPANSF